MKIPESLKSVLTESEINEIKQEFEKQVQIAVESALHQHDEECIKQVKALESQINETHSIQLNKLMTKAKQTFDNRVEKVKAKYEAIMTEDAEKFKRNLSESIETLIDKNISKILPYETIKESARNKTAMLVLEGLRKQLSVDSALMKESIRTPMLEARNKMAGAASFIKSLKKKNQQLNEELSRAKADLLIEGVVANLPEDEANHMRLMLEGKDAEFINNQSQYILGLYKKGKAERRENLRKQATSRSMVTEAKRSSDLFANKKGAALDAESLLISEIAAGLNA